MATRCSECGFENPSGANVCGRCAMPIARVCRNCGFRNPGNFRFCGNCGTRFDPASTESRGSSPEPALPARPAVSLPSSLAEKIERAGREIEGERRTVTILFSDISGFTAISETLDPEQVYDFVDRLHDTFNQEIYRHEGWVDKWMGDGMMSLFGAPIAHEDDPARAVRAALGMQDALRRVNQDLEDRLGITLKVRIGLNSGTVVVGRVGSDYSMDYTALGDSVNVASRLQGVAEPGTILVSRAVFDQTHPLFEFQELGSIRVKNRLEPIEIYEVLAPRRLAGRVRGIPGLVAPMVGRAQELARLERAADELLEHGRGQIVLVTGNAGIGKSRLTAEVKRHLSDGRAAVLEGACLSYGQPAYGVFLQLLKSLFAVEDGDPDGVVRDKIERTTKSILDSSSTFDILPYVEHLFSLRVEQEDLAARIRHLAPAQLQQQTFLAIRDLLVAKARGQALVLVFEDIHWIDPLSLDLLTFILGAVEQSPILVYCISRPDGDGVQQVQRLCAESYSDHWLHLPLTPLSQADSTALLDRLLTRTELPESLKQMIPARAEGNPFYLEEIIRMLIDRAVIQRSGDRWQVDPEADLTALQVPSTLQGLIMARVDHLSERTRQVIQCAAVIGRDLSSRLLATVLDGSFDAEEDVRELEERELIDRRPAPDWDLRFHHVLIQETVYNSLLARRRERLHYKIAAGIEAVFRERIADNVERLAFHYAESTDYARALPYVIRAGERAADRFANDEALRYYRQASEFLFKTNATVDQRIQTYSGLGSVQNLVADYTGAIDSYRTALELTRTSAVQPAHQLAELMRRIGRVYERRGEYADAQRWLDDSIAELDREPSAAHTEERARILNDIGWVCYRRGQFDQAYQWRMRSLELIENTDHYGETASAYAGLVALYTRRGDWANAVAYGEKGLRLREMIGDTFGVSQSHTSLGAIAGEQCDWDRALHHFEQALEIKTRIGDIGGISRLNSNIGFLFLEKGEAARALQYCQRALEIAEKIKNGNLICLALNNLAAVRIAGHNYAEAETGLTRSQSVAVEMGSREELAEAHSLLAEARFGLESFDRAADSAQQAVTLASEIGSPLIEAQSTRTLAKIARARGDLDAADAYLQHALSVQADLKNPSELAKSQFQLALIERDRRQLRQARVNLEQALETFERLGAQAEIAQTKSELDRLGAPAVETGDPGSP
ncbi:MAG: tetratricopeptide repeat protein [Chloroflexi bacterium]|nr:tetratricopeptide repeat protein [Chloroflexota bacterium]